MKKLMSILIISILLISLNFSPCKLLSSPGDTITIASWNLKNFGQTKLNDPDRIDIIVDVIKKFDIIAIQEVQDVSLRLPGALLEKINSDGVNYNYVASNRVGSSSRKEQYLIYYNTDKIEFVDDTDGHHFDYSDNLSREPYYAMFRAGNFDFYLFTIHTDPDEVEDEIPELGLAYLELQYKTQDEDDIILLGDFNAKAPQSSFGSYTTMTSMTEINNIHFCILEETNTRGGKSYDNILFQANYTSEYADSSGVYTFWEDYGLSEDEGFSISDHLLVYSLFLIPNSDDD